MKYPHKGNTIIMIETYLRSTNRSYEAYDENIYYVDTKRRKIWKQDGLTINKKNVEFLSRIKQRSISELVKTYYSDAAELKNVFSEFDINITEIGVL